VIGDLYDVVPALVQAPGRPCLGSGWSKFAVAPGLPAGSETFQTAR
jgi:hypothetical protein